MTQIKMTQIKLVQGDAKLVAYNAGNDWARVIITYDDDTTTGISLSEEQRKELGRFLLGEEENKND